MNHHQNWNQVEVWKSQTGELIPVEKLSKREILGILYASNMLVQRHPKTSWIYTSILWDAIAIRAKALFDESTTARKEHLARTPPARTGPLAKRSFHPARLEGMQ